MTEQLNISELRERIDAAITTVCSGMAAMSIPPNPRDVDLVLADCAKMLDERDRFAKTISDAAYDVGEYDHLQEAEELLQQCVAKYSYEQVSKVGKRLRQWRDKWALILDTQWQVSKERDALKAKLAALVEATAEVHEKLRINADGKATVTVGKAIALRRELGEALAAAKQLRGGA